LKVSQLKATLAPVLHPPSARENAANRIQNKAIFVKERVSSSFLEKKYLYLSIDLSNKSTQRDLRELL